jgi:Fic family protein
MNYMTTNEAAAKWNLSSRRIRVLCENGQIPGAVKIGRNWSMPQESIKPIDQRFKIKIAYQGIVHDFSKIDQLKKRIDSYRPFSSHIRDMLRQNLIVEWTYNSNAIEGNTLTLSETKVVLEGITVGGKSMKEHLETINHKDAIVFLEQLVRGEEAISEWNIKNIHKLILKDIDDSNAGKYRLENVLISGANHVPPHHFMVPQLMQKLVQEYNHQWKSLHPIVQACLLHGEFTKVHPFIDGNGRTARLLLNFVLLRNGYPPIIIKKESRLNYYEALDEASAALNYDKFIKMAVRLVEESELKWLNLLS